MNLKEIANCIGLLQQEVFELIKKDVIDFATIDEKDVKCNHADLVLWINNGFSDVKSHKEEHDYDFWLEALSSGMAELGLKPLPSKNKKQLKTPTPIGKSAKNKKACMKNLCDTIRSLIDGIENEANFN